MGNKASQEADGAAATPANSPRQPGPPGGSAGTVKLQFYRGGVRQICRVYRGTSLPEVLRFVVGLMGLDPSRADGAMTLDEDGVPMLLDLALVPDDTKVFLQLGGGDDRGGGAGAGGGAAEGERAGTAGGTGTGVSNAAGGATGTSAPRGTRPPSASEISSPTATNSRTWTWDPSLMTSTSHQSYTLSQDNRKLGSGDMHSAPAGGCFSMPVVRSTCKFTSGVHRFTLKWENPSTYNACGLISESEAAKCTTTDFGMDFRTFPSLSINEERCTGMVKHTLDMDARRLTIQAGGTTRTVDVPAGPVYVAAVMKGNGSGSSVEIIHE